MSLLYQVCASCEAGAKWLELCELMCFVVLMMIISFHSITIEPMLGLYDELNNQYTFMFRLCWDINDCSDVVVSLYSTFVNWGMIKKHDKVVCFMQRFHHCLMWMPKHCQYILYSNNVTHGSPQNAGVFQCGVGTLLLRAREYLIIPSPPLSHN